MIRYYTSHKLKLSLFMMTGSYYGSFLTRPQLELYKREAMWGQDGLVSEYLYIKRVSPRYSYGYRFGTGENVEKKEQFQALHVNMNELIVFHDIARYRI